MLVFRHTDFPEAGIQVLAGTLEPGESPASAVMREAREETGLADLALVRFLGETVYAMHDFPDALPSNERHHRYFFHLRCLGDLPSTWRHAELHGPDGAADPIEAEFFRAELPDGVPPLIRDHDWCVPLLEC